nr:RNA-directed DNA polymerase, eukaryota [Tanacetum cinerariifolium]
MRRKLGLRIVNDILSYTANPLPQHFHFFTSRLDCTSRMSISALMKCTTAIRQFAFGSTADAFDEYLQMTGANNDINVLDNSPLFDDLLDDLAHVVPYVVNGVEYRNGYYLANGIYPEWASFVKSFTVATDPKHTAKDVSAIPNLPCIISKEGFQNVKLSYLGGIWVLFEFDSLASKKKFLNHSSMGSWFTELIQATRSFKNDERTIWISIEGLPIKAWTPNTFYDQNDLSSDGESQEGDVANKADNNESDADRVLKSSFMHENDTAHKDINSCKKREVGSHSEDPFNIYGILDGQKNNLCNYYSDELKFPPGFTPDNNDKKNVEENIKDTTKRVQYLSNKLNDRCSNRGFSSQRKQVSTYDYFVALMGTWAPTSSKLLIISVYTPQGLNERRNLWDYLRTFIDRWEGDTMIMGDFNKVRSEHERRCIGFISTYVCLCLDPHLSDHRPILLRETNYDYGPSPFRFFHSWFAMEGSNYFVETTWKSLNIFEPNGLIRLKKKLQALKIAIKAWSKEANKRSNDRKINIKQNLSEVDKLIDQGKSNDEILIKTITLLNDIQELNNRNAMEISQKAKIRWSIEGDENSKYFHGIMNKKRSQLAIHGTLSNREWISEPHRVKNEIFTRFKKQFSPIQAPSICFDFTFPTHLSSDQVQDLDRTVTYEENKRAVWDCGTNKSHEPDGFSFEFYHKYWTTIDDDVFQAVRDFL